MTGVLNLTCIFAKNNEHEDQRFDSLNAPIATKVVCFFRLLKCLRSRYGKQCGPAPIGAVLSGSTLFASILNLSVLLGNYLHQTSSADDIFRCFFSLALLGLEINMPSVFIVVLL